MTHQTQPISKVTWIDRNLLHPNNYNPNRVLAAELELLKISIIEDGWTQPIVINPDYEIVDGFHRWTVSADPRVYRITKGLIPVVVTAPKSIADQQMATIRHNRARGTHGVLDMAKIVSDLINANLSQQEIETRLQMESEEVIRLANRSGIAQSSLIQDRDFSNAWIAKSKEDAKK